MAWLGRPKTRWCGPAPCGPVLEDAWCKVKAQVLNPLPPTIALARVPAVVDCTIQLDASADAPISSGSAAAAMPAGVYHGNSRWVPCWPCMWADVLTLLVWLQGIAPLLRASQRWQASRSAAAACARLRPARWTPPWLTLSLYHSACGHRHDASWWPGRSLSCRRQVLQKSVWWQYGAHLPQLPRTLLVATADAPTLMHLQDDDSETARKKQEAERLRAAEKFMVIGAGTATCKGCGYEYKPENGDPDFPIPKGMRFEVSPKLSHLEEKVGGALHATLLPTVLLLHTTSRFLAATAGGVCLPCVWRSQDPF